MLGVAADANHDEIKRAYLERALQFHPDRQADGSAQAREQAEWRMREVNGAWEVLRNPARRASYDAEQRGERPVWERPSGAGVSRAPRTSPVRAGGAPPPREVQGYEVTEPSGSLWKFLPVVVLVVVLLTVVIFTAYANQSGDDSSGDQAGVEVQTGVTYAVGDCVVLASLGGRIVPVPTASCTEPGVQRVSAVTDVGRPCPPPSDAFDVPGTQTRLCLTS